MVLKPLFLISHDIYEVQRLINDSTNAKIGNCESICTPFVYCYISGVKLKSLSFETLYCIDWFFFSFISIYVIRIIKLNPFKIIIITNTCTIHLNP
jgi:hypothetical protein